MDRGRIRRCIETLRDEPIALIADEEIVGAEELDDVDADADAVASGSLATLMAPATDRPPDMNPVVNWPAAMLIFLVFTNQSTESLSEAAPRCPTAATVFRP